VCSRNWKPKIVRWKILDTGKRIETAAPQGSAQHRLRGEACCRAAHGSALFTAAEDPGDGGHHARHGEDEQYYIDAACRERIQKTFLLQ